MKIFTIIFCLFLSVSALGQGIDTVAKHSPATIKFQDTTLHPEKMLIVVDGGIYKDSLKSIDPDSIASISILKYQGATSIYGPQGANGALLITTKKANSAPQNIPIRWGKPAPNIPKPLYVIDGKISAEGVNAINPDDIFRIDVLKGEKATAIYGAAGANGVILVTTKKTESKLDSAKATHIVINDGPPSHKIKVLFVIDGKQNYTNAFDDKNMPKPEDILSVDVLKPATAMARYGKLGENGAVIIRTKSGSVPLYEKKLSTLSQKYKDYLSAHNNNDAEIYYMINGEVLHQQPDLLNNKLASLSNDNIKSIEFYDSYTADLGNKHPTLIISIKK